MSIYWISVQQRVPNTRRDVLVWGYPVRSVSGNNFTDITMPGAFLGVSRCNIDREQSMFDIERPGLWGVLRLAAPVVTHWAEITPPNW